LVEAAAAEDVAPEVELRAQQHHGDDEEVGWNYAPGQEIAPGLHAWELLGDGQRSETWMAWSTLHWSPVTVKVPRPAWQTSERAIASLRREADYLRQLAHPSFQRLLEERLEAPLPLLVCEYVEGPSLSSLIDDGPISPADTVLVGLQLASALHFLHQRGMVHLDLKPGNVLVREGRIVLIDLGLSRPIGSPNPPGGIRGTADYMAPEQCRMEPADPAMDLFALGAVLYELVTGELAFACGPHGDPDRFRQLEGPPAPPSDFVDDFPPELGAVLDALLHPDPSQRLATAAAALQALHGLIPAGDEGLWPDWVTPLLSPTSADRASSQTL